MNDLPVRYWKHARWLKFVLGATLIAIVPLSFSAQPTFASTGWQIVPSTNPVTSGHVDLTGVACPATNYCWAVGQYQNGGNNNYASLTEQWNGSSWSTIASPNVNTSNLLQSVTCLSTSNCWAVGNSGPDPVLNTQTLIEQWNGSKWSVVPSPSPSTGGSMRNFLQSVACVSANDCWAVGFATGNVSGTYQTLAEHWNGSVWAVATTVNTGTQDQDYLFGVTCVSSNNCWGVGASLFSNWQTLIEHYNGTAWSIVPSPNLGPQTTQLQSVSCASSADCWVVGWAGANSLTEHWNGSVWSIVASPNVGPAGNELNGVACLSSNNCWTAGFSFSTGNTQTLVEQWNGSSWSALSTPNSSSNTNDLLAVAVTSNNIWAVGHISRSGFDQSLTLEGINQTATSTAVSSGTNPIAVGAPVTYTANVSPTSATGNVAFDINGVPLSQCSAQPLSNGLATCIATYAASGTYSVTATYSGDVFDSSSVSLAITQTVIANPEGPPQGYTLDGYGGVHPFGSASPVSNISAYWSGWNIARGIVLRSDGVSGYTLDGFGGVHPFGGAPPVSAVSAYWSGWDIARGIVLRSDGVSGYTLDGFGGVHPFGGTPPVSNISAYWSGWNIARGIALRPDGVSGYTLDGYGGVHPFGGASPVSFSAYWSGWDIAKGMN